jgi:signal transduction histidine kinase
LSSYWFLFLELGIGVTLLLGDGMVYQQTRAQSLPWAWPAAGVIAVGVCLGQRAGILSALLVGGTSLFVESTVLDRSVLVSAFSKIGLWLLVGSIAGALTQRLRLAEREISVARTREEVARELHDGVLQTLAVIQRRSDDPALSNMAKDQENSLRLYLADSRAVAMTASEPAGLETTLRETAAGSERLYDLTVQVIVTPDCPDRPDLPAPLIHALAGAVKESIANASKHGDASKVTVFAEPSERDQDRYGLFVSIKDDGAGFIIDEVVEGIGLARSIRGRITEQGGTVELKSRPGRGTEVQLWV